MVFILALDQLTSTENYSFDLVDVPHALLLMKKHDDSTHLPHSFLHFIQYFVNQHSSNPLPATPSRFSTHHHPLCIISNIPSICS